MTRAGSGRWSGGVDAASLRSFRWIPLPGAES